MNSSNSHFQRSRSLGDLRANQNKTKSKSPDLVGRITLQLNTLSWIIHAMEESNSSTVTACLAGWLNGEGENKFITVELSPLYIQKTNRPETSLAKWLTYGD